MASHATFAQRFVLEDKRTALRGVALEAGIVFTQETHPTALEQLWKVRSAAFDGDALVRIMAIDAAHLSFHHWMVMRQLKFCPYFQVALETGVGRFPRINDLARLAAGLDVQTAGTVASFASHLLGVFSFGQKSRVRGCPEIAGDLVVTGIAGIRTDELRAGNTRRRDNCAVCFEVTAGKQKDG